METRIVVISGVSGSGKSTLGGQLRDYLTRRGRRVALLDGDGMREFFQGAFRYSSDDRLMVSKILAYAATLLAGHDTDVILATMLSQPGAREFLQEHADFIEIFCDADLADCIENDQKRVYEQSLGAERPNIVGHDLSFQRPESPDLILRTHVQTPEESFGEMIQLLEQRRLFGLSP
jgi:adenylylsulfate kinase-like enzyme